tara:strand:- start:96 stop:224 length:129 start_codon:yes stop_codon:yes gene_type:complete
MFIYDKKDLEKMTTRQLEVLAKNLQVALNDTLDELAVSNWKK